MNHSHPSSKHLISQYKLQILVDSKIFIKLLKYKKIIRGHRYWRFSTVNTTSIFCEEHKLCTFSSYNYLLPPAISSLSCQIILLSTLFSNTLNSYSSLRTRDQVLYPYKKADKNIVLRILFFTCLNKKQEEEMILNFSVANIPRI